MKILQINKYLYPKGGSETYMFQLSQALEERGHEVKFWGMSHPDNIVQDFNGYEIDFIDYKKQNLIEKITKVQQSLYSLESKNKIVKVLDLCKPDIVHIHNYNFQITPSILPEIKKRGIKIVQTIHDSQMVCPNHRLMNDTLKETCTRCVTGSFFNAIKYKCFDHSLLKSSIGALESMLYHQLKFYDKFIDIYISPSNFLANLLRNKIKSRIDVIPNFVDVKKNLRTKNEGYYLYFGRINDDKGIYELINIFSKTNLNLKIIGDGPEKNNIIRLIENYQNIEYIGAFYKEQLFEYVSRAKYVVQFSKSFENCPMTILESYALGVPVIASRHSGFIDLIKENETGFFIDNIFDIENACKKLELIDTKIDINQFKSNIDSFYNLNYIKGIHINKILNIYNELLSKN